MQVIFFKNEFTQKFYPNVIFQERAKKCQRSVQNRRFFGGFQNFRPHDFLDGMFNVIQFLKKKVLEKFWLFD